VYELENGQLLHVTREGRRLLLALAGQPLLTLLPLSDTLFRIDSPEGNARVAFHPQGAGPAPGGTLLLNTANPMRRVEPWTPGAGELAMLEGRYYSAELETFYTLRMKDHGLVLAHRRHGEITLVPRTRDHFTANVWFIGNLRVERDVHGAVSGLRVTSGRVRNLLLERVSD
jgi:hypothetical protein